MARGTRTQSNAQESEAQRDPAKTSAESTSMTSTSTTDSARLSADDEQTEVQSQVDEMLGKKSEDDAREMISVKTMGPYLVHDMTTNYTVEEKATEVPLSAFIQSQLDAKRIEKA